MEQHMKFREKIGLVREWWPLIIAVASAISSVLFVFVVGLWTLFGAILVEQTRDALGITELAQEVARLGGKNKIITQEEGRSYVKEPVIRGDKLQVVLYARRTEVGAACTYLGSIPLFTDDKNITLAGDRRPPIRQLNAVNNSPLLLKIDLPPDLTAGRVMLQLQWDYKCGELDITQLSEPLFFILKERDKQ